MLTIVLQKHLDLVLFTVLAVAVSVAVHRHVRRRTGEAGLSRGFWIALLLVLGVGSVSALVVGNYERSRLVAMLEGVAPTYAMELQRLGHDRMRIDTPADDAFYLSLIETEKRWLKTNPAVADIYTFGKNDKGEIVLLVDSETDYNRNGVIDAELEQRTDIGEVYDEADEELMKAFEGQATFAGTPAADRWGVWVAAYVPMFNDKGEVYAVLGVDYPAEAWVKSIVLHRIGTLGIVAVVLSVLLGSSASGALMRNEIARRTRTEAALRASEGRLRTIVENEPECVMMVSREGTVLEINPAGLRMAEAVVGQIVGQPVYQIIRTEYHERFREHHALAFSGRSEIVEVEFQGLHGGLQRLWMEIHSVPLRDEDGRVVSVLSVARDVTIRKQAEAQRELLQRQLVDASRHAGMAEVATNVLHNVGNVLNSVNVSADLVSSRLAQSKLGNVGKAAELLTQNAGNLGQFLAEDQRGKQLPGYLSMLAQHLAQEQKDMQAELAKLSSGIEHIKEVVRAQQSHARNSSTLLQLVDPSQVIQEALRVCFPDGNTGSVKAACEAADVGQGKMDKHKVLQILINLLSNARHAVEQSGRSDPAIRVRMSAGEGESGPCLRIAVEDNGLGIAPQHHERIFQHGFTTRDDGHGFGLHGAALAAKEMGGCLRFSSEGAGKGAVFTLEIPWAKACAEA